MKYYVVLKNKTNIWIETCETEDELKRFLKTARTYQLQYIIKGGRIPFKIDVELGS